jgi:hypothetical protein
LSKPDLLIWFGALVAVNLQTAFLSPPVAMSAYYLRNVVPQWSLATIFQGNGGLHGHSGHLPGRAFCMAGDSTVPCQGAAIGGSASPDVLSPCAVGLTLLF